MKITRAVVACWPFLWSGISAGMFLQERALFPTLTPDYLMPIMFGFLFSMMLTMVIRVFIWVMFEHGKL
jgi:hypothetical protein